MGVGVGIHNRSVGLEDVIVGSGVGNRGVSLEGAGVEVGNKSRLEVADEKRTGFSI